MTPNEYQIACLRTQPSLPTEMEGVINCALGLTGEAGEVADLVKKAVYQGHEFDKEHYVKELGDVLWYIATGASAVGYSLNEIMQINIEKLKNRYPDGFDAENSMHRAAGDI